MDPSEQSTILEKVAIIEDQLFILHNLQLASNKINVTEDVNQLEHLFLSEDSVHQCFKFFSDQLFKLDVKEEDMIGIVMRGLCSCITLKENVFSAPRMSEIKGLTTIQDLDSNMCEVLSSWTSTCIQILMTKVKDMVRFLSCFGGVFVLPDGLTGNVVHCFWCRYNNALDSEMNSDICTHYVVEKPHLSTNKVDIGDREDNTDFQQEDDNLSLHLRIHVRERKRQLMEMRKTIQQMQTQYSLYSAQRDFILSIKQISPFLYSIIGKLLIFMQNRVKSIMRFSPSMGCPSVRDAMGSHQCLDPSTSRERLLCCLKRVSLSSTNMKIIHERFEALSLDPLSIVCGQSSMLRTSIVAKKVLLALKQSPEKIVNDYQSRCKALPEKILDDKPETLLDQMFAVVVIITAYNSWLSSQLVNPTLHIKVGRGDIGDVKSMELTLLYDFRQMGFQIDSDTRVVGVYGDVVDICIFHLSWLHKKRLCPQSQIINSVVT
jgi:hypothetical protein